MLSDNIRYKFKMISNLQYIKMYFPPFFIKKYFTVFRKHIIAIKDSFKKQILYGIYQMIWKKI